jgi:hypothetical protein
MASMLRTNSDDTICHEHLEYYSIIVVKAVVEAAGLALRDVEEAGRLPVAGGDGHACPGGGR